jgi:5-methylcytosine-specific restriction endonuclease McrA
MHASRITARKQSGRSGVVVEEQHCPKCGNDLPLDAYSPSKRGKTGSYCMECAKAVSRQHYQENRERALANAAEYRCEHRDQVNAYNKKWRDAHPEKTSEYHRKHYQRYPEKYKGKPSPHARNPERALIYTQKWRERNREQHMRTLNNWRERNRERVNGHARAWRRRNPMKARSQGAKKRAMRRAAMKGNYVDLQAVWERDQGICYLCGKAIDPTNCHFDHVVPIIKGGSHSEENIRATHARCNLKKGAKLLTEI